MTLLHGSSPSIIVEQDNIDAEFEAANLQTDQTNLPQDDQLNKVNQVNSPNSSSNNNNNELRYSADDTAISSEDLLQQHQQVYFFFFFLSFLFSYFTK